MAHLFRHPLTLSLFLLRNSYFKIIARFSFSQHCVGNLYSTHHCQWFFFFPISKKYSFTEQSFTFSAMGHKHGFWSSFNIPGSWIFKTKGELLLPLKCYVNLVILLHVELISKVFSIFCSFVTYMRMILSLINLSVALVVTVCE